MNTTAETLQNEPIETKAPDVKPQGFTLQRKILGGFSGLMLLMALCIAITLYELTTIEKSTISVINHQLPVTIQILSLSEDLNLTISLLNENLLSGNEEDTEKYQRISQRLYTHLENIEEKTEHDNQRLSAEKIEQIRTLLDEIGKHGARLIFLVKNVTENYSGLKLAAEQLNPPALQFMGIINEIIATNDIDAPPEKAIEVREHLYKLRYTWLQMMNSIRLYFSQINNEFKKANDDLVNFSNYSELNGQTLKLLQKMDVDIGFDTVENLAAIRANFLEKMTQVIDIRLRGEWRADVTLMRTKVKPLVNEIRSLLVGLVVAQIQATNTSGHALTSSLEQIRIYTITLLAFALCSGLIISIMITNSILPPIKKLMEAARQVSTGNLNAEVHLTTKDEIGLLGGSFNTMVNGLRSAEIEKQHYTSALEILNTELEDRVASRTIELKRSEARIRTVYDNVGEGIIVIDDKGYIDSINSAAQRIFSVGKKDINGMHAIFLLADKKYSDLARSEDYNDEKDGPFKASNSKLPIELEGKRIDGSTFPIEMVVTNMLLGDNNMRACIVRDITQRKEVETRLAEAQHNVVNAAHKSGMAEMATGVLHNIGNILNSVNISVEEVSRIARNSKIQGLMKANAMLSDNLQNVGDFITRDSKGKRLPEYYVKIGGVIESELNQIIKESKSLGEKTTMMKEVISTQQAYATAGFFTEEFQVAPLVEDALKVQAASLYKWNINVIKNFSAIPNVAAQKSKLLQVITNLIKNAKEATSENDDLNKKREIIIEINSYNKNAIYISVYDNGCGIIKENLSNVFTHGFTTKETGHGFGLHSAANAMTEMGGSLTVSSSGPQQGACFTVSIPTADAAQQGTDKNSRTDALKVSSENWL